MKSNNIKRLVLAAMFLALGIVLPRVVNFAGLQPIGEMLLPMHIPILLCGLICGPFFGAVVGFIVPLLTSAFFSMPPMYPIALAMAFELAAYGLVAGVVYMLLSKRPINFTLKTYISLIVAMLVGRIVMGISFSVLVAGGFGLKTFISAAFVTAWPGILIQLILIPAIMHALKRARQIR